MSLLGVIIIVLIVAIVFIVLLAWILGALARGVNDIGAGLGFAVTLVSAVLIAGAILAKK